MPYSETKSRKKPDFFDEICDHQYFARACWCSSFQIFAGFCPIETLFTALGFCNGAFIGMDFSYYLTLPSGRRMPRPQSLARREKNLRYLSVKGLFNFEGIRFVNFCQAIFCLFPIFE